MFTSSVTCRQQEAHHRQIAAETNLPNVRRVALAAARAWAAQALEAEDREAGSRDVLTDEDAAIALEFLREDEADALALVDPSSTREPSELPEARGDAEQIRRQP